MKELQKFDDQVSKPISLLPRPMTVEKTMILALLRVGRSRIEAGWVKGVMVYTSPYGARAYCAAGGILGGNIHDKTLSPAHKDAYFALGAALPSPWGNSNNVPGFNDWPGTTLQDVLHLYDRAITNVEAA